MKKTILLIASILLISTSVLAKSETPLLVVTKGGILRSGGVKTTCSIYADHPKIQSELSEIRFLIQEASLKEIRKGRHIMAQDPSIEVFAIHKENSGAFKTISLFEDASDITYRDGPVALQLKKLALEICFEEKNNN